MRNSDDPMDATARAVLCDYKAELTPPSNAARSSLALLGGKLGLLADTASVTANTPPALATGSGLSTLVGVTKSVGLSIVIATFALAAVRVGVLATTSSVEQRPRELAPTAEVAVAVADSQTQPQAKATHEGELAPPKPTTSPRPEFVAPDKRIKAQPAILGRVPPPQRAPEHPVTSSQSRLRAEIEVMSALRARMTANDFEGGERLANRHEREFPDGIMKAENAAIKVQLACEAARRAPERWPYAQKRARAYLLSHPTSTRAQVVRSRCEVE